jgi:hypothetical protein
VADERFAAKQIVPECGPKNEVGIIVGALCLQRSSLQRTLTFDDLLSCVLGVDPVAGLALKAFPSEFVEQLLLPRPVQHRCNLALAEKC